MVTMNISRMLMTRKRMRSIEESTSQHLHHKRIVKSFYDYNDWYVQPALAIR